MWGARLLEQTPKVPKVTPTNNLNQYSLLAESDLLPTDTENNPLRVFGKMLISYPHGVGKMDWGRP